jgi:tetratricopeptide (TPR) repeat protein
LRLTCVPAGALLLLAVAAAPTLAQTDDYLAVVTRARQGDLPQALPLALAWSPATIATETRDWPNGEPAARCVDDCVRAAILLHTETAMAHLLADETASMKANLHAADELSQRWLATSKTPNPSRVSFDRRRRLAVGYLYQGWERLSQAKDTYQSVLDQDHNDPEALVAMGAYYEQLDAMPRRRPSDGASAAPRRTDWWLATAATFYEKALAVRPDDAEARLRLGRTLARRGKPEAAKVELERALAGTRRPEAVAWTHCFLGAIEEEAAHLDAAIEHYTLAMAADPHLQTAPLALSQALQSAGRVTEAASVLRRGLATTSDENGHGWLGYHTDTLHGYRRSMDGLWRESAR